jgi:hypothetical protein
MRWSAIYFVYGATVGVVRLMTEVPKQDQLDAMNRMPLLSNKLEKNCKNQNQSDTGVKEQIEQEEVYTITCRATVGVV